MKREFDARMLPLPGAAEVAAHEVEVWFAPVALSDGSSVCGDWILSQDERTRAKSMAPIPRRRFMETRTLLRKLLSAYLGVEPRAIKFAYGQRGKPVLAKRHSARNLHFSVSHTQTAAVFAFGRSALGVDIEGQRGIPNLEALARRFLAIGEIKALRSLPETEKEEAFLNCWTRKEAYAKALGEGIAMGFRNFEVTVSTGRGTALLGPDGNPDPSWAIRDLYPASGIAGALAVNRPDCLLWCWQLEPAA